MSFSHRSSRDSTSRSQASPLPASFLSRLSAVFGPADLREVQRTFIRRPTTFRVNTLKTTTKEVLQNLAREAFKVRRLDWCSTGFVLLSRSQRELEKLPLYANGEIYLQSLASMIPPLVLEPRADEQVLDVTAAPGSKTSQIAAMMEGRGRLVACELNGVRFERLKHNLTHLGVDTENFVELHRGNAAQILRGDAFAGVFDRVLLDAPCSAEARFIEGDRATTRHWSEQFVLTIAAEQRKLLDAAWQALKPGGVLVYSTCTFAPEENEQQISSFLDRHSDAILEPVALKGSVKLIPGITKGFNPTLRHTARIMPNREIEGFYLARIKKRSLSTI